MGAAPRYTQQSDAKFLQMKTLSYSYMYIKYTPRVPSILLIVEKLECENFDFVLLFSDA